MTVCDRCICTCTQTVEYVNKKFFPLQGRKKHIVKNSANVNLKIQVHFDKYTRIYIYCKIEIVLFKIYPTPMISVSLHAVCLHSSSYLFTLHFEKKGGKFKIFPLLPPSSSESDINVSCMDSGAKTLYFSSIVVVVVVVISCSVTTLRVSTTEI